MVITNNKSTPINYGKFMFLGLLVIDKSVKYSNNISVVIIILTPRQTLNNFYDYLDRTISNTNWDG